MEQQQSLLPKTIFDERYEILSVAGEGGMGKVYRARHVNLDRIVAIKILRPEYALNVEVVRRFKQEAQMASDLSHPNIAGVQSFGVVDNQPYIVFDFLEGQSLHTILDEGSTFSFAEFINVFKQAVGGVAHAHANGVIHRDIKPGNVFLLGDDPATCNVSILDFGIAKAIESNGASGQKLTATGVLLGTPLYMSPEQGRGEQVSYSADVYSLGCLMYHAIFGKPPFEGESAYQVLFNHSYQPLVLDMVPSGYPEGILPILEKSMAKDPQERYRNAGELLAALGELARQKPSGKLSRSFRTIRKKAPKKAPKQSSGGQAPKIRFTIPRQLMPLIPLMAMTLAVVCWWTFLRDPVKEIESDWTKSYDTATLAKRLADLDSTRPDLGERVIKDLRDELLAHPSLDGISIFFHQTEVISGSNASKVDDKYVDDGLWILRQLHEDAWHTNPQQAKDFVERWATFTRVRAGADDEGKQLLFLAMTLKFDCNDSAAKAAGNLALQKFMPLNNIGGDVAKLADEVADVFSTNGDKQSALQFASIIEKTTDPSLQYMAACRKASIFDSLHEPDRAFTEWKKALEASNRDDGATIDMRLRALQGMADDETALGQVPAALTHYSALRKAATPLANAPVKWDLLVRLGDGYAALNHDTEATEAFGYGLSESRSMAAVAQGAGDKVLAARALMSAGRFLNHMDLAEQGVPEMDKGVPLTANLLPHDLRPIHAILLPNRPLGVEQMRAASANKQLSGAAQSAAATAEREALHQSLISEWCALRGDDLAAGQHAGMASEARVKVLGPGTTPDAMLAATYYYAARRYFEIEPWSRRVDSSTESTPEQKMQARAMLANAYFYRGDYVRAKKWFHRTLHDMRSTKVPTCVEGYLNYALMEERDKNYVEAIDEAGSAYDLAHEFGWWHPQFRYAGFLRLKMYRITRNWSQSLDFGRRLREAVSPRHSDLTPPDVARRQLLMESASNR